MIRVGLLRHGETEWNADGRIQGRTDVPLSAAGREQVASWRLPPGFERARCCTSPLGRAVETARRLGFPDPRIEPRLVEMAWGGYEGRRIPELRAELGLVFTLNEAMGLDFRPPGGERPREVAARLASFLADLAREEDARPAVLVTHKGVIRAALILACGWDMLAKPPLRLRRDDALTARLTPDGRLTDPAVVSLRPEHRP